MKPPCFSLVVALPAEAKPINRFFNLKRENRWDRFPLYTNGETALVISGVGRERAFAATRWLHLSVGQSQDSLWLNLGIAGHPDRRLGEAVIVSEIVDQRSGESWNLCPPTQALFGRERLVTLQQPSSDYLHQALHDMEAAGFYGAACQFASQTKIMVIKIVSDNCANPIDNINGKMVSLLIEQQLDRVNQFINISFRRLSDFR